MKLFPLGLSPSLSPRMRHGGIVVLLSALSVTKCGDSPVTPTPPPTDPPAISCPASQQVSTLLGQPVSVVYGTPTVVGGTTPVAVSCVPSSGSTFPIGATSVTCTATDAKQRASSCSLTVTVTAPAQLSLTRFAAFGDSITLGEDGTAAVTASVGGKLIFGEHIVLTGLEYPSDLQLALRSRYPTQACVTFVQNLGRGGEQVGVPPGDPDGGLARFSATVLGGGYQAVLIMEGSNDAYWAFFNGPGNLPLVTTNLRTMITQAKAAGIRPYLATLPPALLQSACIPSCRGYGEAFIPGLNSQIRNLAQTEGVTLVDVSQAFGGDLTLLSTDGLHPNAAGFQRIADTFLAAIRSTLERSTPGPSACS
ncbi:MAG: GDSL-type esterase/lipase family protein [Vicinamibacterales bacterium]